MLSLHTVTGLAKESTPTRLNGDTGRQSRKVVPEKKEQPESCGGRKRRKPKALPWDSPGKNTGVALPCPPPGDLPNPGIRPRYTALQEDSLWTEPLGKPYV